MRQNAFSSITFCVAPGKLKLESVLATLIITVKSYRNRKSNYEILAYDTEGKFNIYAMRTLNNIKSCHIIY